VQFLTSQKKTAGNVRNVSKTFMGLTLSTEVQFGAGDTCVFRRINERQGWGLAVGCVTDHAGPHYILRIVSLQNKRSIVVLSAALKNKKFIIFPRPTLHYKRREKLEVLINVEGICKVSLRVIERRLSKWGNTASLYRALRFY
jgi:hypothetical protein